MQKTGKERRRKASRNDKWNQGNGEGPSGNRVEVQEGGEKERAIRVQTPRGVGVGRKMEKRERKNGRKRGWKRERGRWEHLGVQERRGVSAGTSSRAARGSGRGSLHRWACALVGVGWKWRNRASTSFPLVNQQGKVASVPSMCTEPAQEVGTRLPTWLEELGKLNQG